MEQDVLLEQRGGGPLVERGDVLLQRLVVVHVALLRHQLAVLLQVGRVLVPDVGMVAQTEQALLVGENH